MEKNFYFLVLTLFLLFLNCNEDGIKIINKEKGSSYEEIIKNELAKNIRNDEIFLGYKFGMTKNQFSLKTNELLNSKVVYTDKYITYDLHIESYKFKCTYSPEYYNDKLYRFGVSVTSDESYVTPELISTYLRISFMNKYLSDADIEKNSILNKKIKDYIWINGNRETKIINGINDARIFYTDLIADKEKKENELKENERKTKETINNL